MYLVWCYTGNKIVTSTFTSLNEARDFASKCANKHPYDKFWVTKFIEEHWTQVTFTGKINTHNHE